jgi:heme/copper-type cytochrome/quinol oxidase subunit 1
MLTAEAAALVVTAIGVAWFAHRTGRSASWRARLRRLLRHPAVACAAVAFAVAGGRCLALLPRSQDLPRRYADYLPDDGAGAATAALPEAVLAVLLIGGGVVLGAVWLWLRYGGMPGRRGSLLRHGVPVVGGMLLLAGLVGDWIAGRMAPASFGWYLYAPLTNDTDVPPGFGGEPHIAHVMAVSLGVLGLCVLTAIAAFRAGRKETWLSGEG